MNWPGLGNGPAKGFWVGARLRRQRSHVRIVSGAPEKRVPRVPGLWRTDPRGISCVMVYLPAGYFDRWRSLDPQLAVNGVDIAPNPLTSIWRDVELSNSSASVPMSTESQLREKLRKIEALFAGAGTAGERLAAEAALERVRERLTELGRQDPSIEMQFSMPDQWSRHLFLALCRRYGMKPYRYYRQRRNTVMVRAPKRFLDQVLWPEFSELDQALQAYLHQVTLRVIREEVYADASEAQEVSEALPPN